jgi:undecaprenyl-diphosphatase
MTLIQAIILGIIQGLTEFLPVSSSGHLVLGEALLGVVKSDEIGLAFEVFVHFGTLLAVLTIYWRDVVRMVQAFFSIFSFNRPSLEEKYHQDQDFKWMVLILLGSVPAGFIGLALEDIIEDAFSSPILVCVMLLVTATLLFFSRFFRREDEKLNSTKALLIGCAQAIAIIPGISRSGSTITAALFLRMDRESAAKFSFLLSIPVIAGATLIKFKDLLIAPPETSMIINFIVGTLFAYISGILAIKFLLAILRRGNLDRFAIYCYTIGIIGIIGLLFF